jgi:hypothetical protein
MASTSATTMMMNCSNENTNLYEIGLKLRFIEILLQSCQHLIKQSTSIDICAEIFVEETNNFTDKLVRAGNDLKTLCTNTIKETEMKRDNITIVDSHTDEFINRDPGKRELLLALLRINSINLHMAFQVHTMATINSARNNYVTWSQLVLYKLN